MRWGMPTPPQYMKGEVDYGVTNIRNPKSVDRASQPLRWPSDELCRIRQGTGSGDQKETDLLVGTERGQTAILVRRHLEDLVRCPEKEGRPSPSRHFRFPDDLCQRGRQTRPCPLYCARLTKSTFG